MRVTQGVLVLALMAAPFTLYAEEAATSAKPVAKVEGAKAEVAKVEVGSAAPDFQITDSKGKVINLSELTKNGPVLVRLTCGCSGCDKELAYFQELHKAYAGKGLTSLAVFKEPDAKVAKYVEEKKLNMLYAVDSKGESWKVFQTTTMPTNILIEKGGKIAKIAAGCNPDGLIAKKLSDTVAGLVDAEKVDVKAEVDAKAKK